MFHRNSPCPVCQKPDHPGDLFFGEHGDLRRHPEGEKGSAETGLHHAGEKLFRGKALSPGEDLHQGGFPYQRRLPMNIRHLSKPKSTPRFEMFYGDADMQLRLRSGGILQQREYNRYCEKNEKRQKKAGFTPPSAVYRHLFRYLLRLFAIWRRLSAVWMVLEFAS
jgi:hypothetical protein